MNKKFDVSLVLSGILIATYAIVLYLLISRFNQVTAQIHAISRMFAPFIYALGIAYVINLIMTFIEERFLSFTTLSKNNKRGLAILVSFVLVVFTLSVILTFVLPQLGDSLRMLFTGLPGYTRQLINYANELLEKFDIDLTLEYINTLPWQTYLNKTIDWLTSSFTSVFQTTLGTTLDITKFLFEIVMAISISIYLLTDKEKLIFQLKKIVMAVLPRKFSMKILNVSTLTNHTLKRYLSGQLVEAFVIGILTFVGLLLLKLPFALLIGTIVGVTALVPVLGPMVGNFIGTFILFMIKPMHALVFFIFITVLQQIDNSFIYPKIVGESIGLSGLWVLMAILVGGSFFGLFGIILGVPFMAVLYSVMSELIHYLLRRRNISESEIS